MPDIPPKDVMLANARALRRAMTPWERKLWYCFLRTHPAKFYKQHTFGPYIVDFCCPRSKIVIELDGSQHYLPEGQASDADRNARLKAQGFDVLRFPTSTSIGASRPCVKPSTWRFSAASNKSWRPLT